MPLRVFVGSVFVGRIVREGAAVAFRLDPSYAAMRPRPVLSLALEGRALPVASETRPYTERELPAFFRNVLPEAALLERLLRELDAPTHREVDLLAHVGGDLAGDLRVTRDELRFAAPHGHAPSHGGESPPGHAPVYLRPQPLRFALSGVQLKLSVLCVGARIAVPPYGVGGRWIAKFSWARYPGIVENEFTVMRWAQRAGLHVAEHALRDTRDFVGEIPDGIDVDRGRVLLLKRFDRTHDGPALGRIHQEDFAQVLGVGPEHKYGLADGLFDESLHLATIAAVVRACCGPADSDEFLCRVAFAVLSGNGDMHLKNWSLYYPDGVTPRLAPAYDLLCTLQHAPHNDQLALGLCDVYDRAMTEVSLSHFDQVADVIGEERGHVRAVITAFVRRALEAWNSVRAEPETPMALVHAVEHLLPRLALVAECAG